MQISVWIIIPMVFFTIAFLFSRPTRNMQCTLYCSYDRVSVLHVNEDKWHKLGYGDFIKLINLWKKFQERTDSV